MTVTVNILTHIAVQDLETLMLSRVTTFQLPKESTCNLCIQNAAQLKTAKSDNSLLVRPPPYVHK